MFCHPDFAIPKAPVPRALVPLLLLLTLSTFGGQVRADGLRPAELAGSYRLESVREMGSNLLLRPDGKFEWSMIYGADDQFASGTWAVTGGDVVLDAAAPAGSPTFRVFREDEMRIRKPAGKETWIAIVGMPRVGPAAGMEVVFESRRSLRRTAVTDRNGDATVDMPASESWSRVGLRKKGDTANFQWLPVPPQRAAARIAAFAIDDAKWIVPQAFDRLLLKRRGSDLVSEDGRLVYSR